MYISSSNEFNKRWIIQGDKLKCLTSPEAGFWQASYKGRLWGVSPRICRIIIPLFYTTNVSKCLLIRNILHGVYRRFKSELRSKFDQSLYIERWNGNSIKTIAFYIESIPIFSPFKFRYAFFKNHRIKI